MDVFLCLEDKKTECNVCLTMNISFVFVLALTRNKSFGNFLGVGERIDWWAPKRVKARTSAAQPISELWELQECVNMNSTGSRELDNDALCCRVCEFVCKCSTGTLLYMSHVWNFVHCMRGNWYFRTYTHTYTYNMRKYIIVYSTGTNFSQVKQGWIIASQNGMNIITSHRLTL